MKLESKLEAALFANGEPMTITELAALCDEEVENIFVALDILESHLAERGIRLSRRAGEVCLVTAPDASELVASLRAATLTRDLGKAGLETLTIVLYRGPLAKAKIDYIRGVNSLFILRVLLVRGLVEKAPNPKDARSPLYQPTFQLLSLLGVTKVEDLPEYEALASREEEEKKEDAAKTQETREAQPVYESQPEDDYVPGIHDEDW